ncbi:alpha-L-rhamnosidase C-terminal domain-containing protein [Chitinophaga defluvii]|uniref:Alpha-L-rhamnosidase C-terminal domain-containing protein n=1 Tax=Chitinophaga defluvii TaxID=3163343 RepID=A0ABV2T425_9BACT
MKSTFILILLCLFQTTVWAAANEYGKAKGIIHNANDKTIRITVPDQRLSLFIDYSHGCRITQLTIKNKNTLSPSGIYTGIRTDEALFHSYSQTQPIHITTTPNGIKLKGITYGDNSNSVNESWYFELAGDKIQWVIDREYNNTTTLQEMALPEWNFQTLSTWKGGILDNGGMVWCKYLSKPHDTYGVHTGGVTFWNAASSDALRIAVNAGDNHAVATKYSHSGQHAFTCTHFVTEKALGQRYHLSRFVSQRSDVFAPCRVKKGNIRVNIELQYIDYSKAYTRGTLPGIDAIAVRELMNTTGRYGVVDNNIVGANGWITNWKCLHEPFFAQIGMALNDKHYTQNLSATLDQERDMAMQEDGRVLSRWHNAPGDEIPGTFNPATGYYEAMWGYTIDSQTGYVINTAEQFDLTGDIRWLHTHKKSCEKALDWLIKRDSNNNGIFEMMNNNISEQKASDWLDIVWAGFENAFVNAQLYEALSHWANCELILGDQPKSAYYAAIAARLKTAFNKPVEEGGFWSSDKKQYVYWRDNDGSVHGDNLVTPVNFAAITFGLCDNKQRIAMILDQIEERANAESLFHWPLCFDSFKRAEVHDNNWPFPRYENGDIFPTWGYLGIRCYANYDKQIALKYINNILDQYNKDGLSSQRYSRKTQSGLGEDILAGISTTITALYRDIYGIRPKWNRMGIEPNMISSLNGTRFSYTLRDTVYQLTLSVDDYQISTTGFSIRSKYAFGVNKAGKSLIYYPDNKEIIQLAIDAASNRPIKIAINNWEADHYSWKITSTDSYKFNITGLIPGTQYRLSVNNRQQPLLTVQTDGTLSFRHTISSPATFNLQKSGETNLQIPAIDSLSPYQPIHGGSITAQKVISSPDPLVSYVWHQPGGELQVYHLTPTNFELSHPGNFENTGSALTDTCNILVKGTGSIRFDFGTESAAWMEFESPDLSGEITAGISEYNQPAVFNAGPQSPVKTAVPVKHGNVYRLELNKELYEGVRFGWINISKFDKPWHITNVRLVCQTKPVNYAGAFECSDTLLNRMWYTGAYAVKLNLLKDYIGAILIDRGDRHSWTGDSHISQGVSMAVFSNYDMIKHNLTRTAPDNNAIESYSLYWVLSLLDYFYYSGDKDFLQSCLPVIQRKINHADSALTHDTNLGFYGWDERLGAGFENPNCRESKFAFKMLFIQTCLRLSKAMPEVNAQEQQMTYERLAIQQLDKIRKDSNWTDELGIHSAADAINGNFLSERETGMLLQKHYLDPVNTVSFSPFNQYFIIKAMAAAGIHREALSTIDKSWGGQLRLGATTFWECFRPEWENFLKPNDPVPNGQHGYTSLCHPWSSGITKWLSEEILGIKPSSPGFKTYQIIPHLNDNLTRVKGKMPTPLGDISFELDTEKGIGQLISPPGSEGHLAIPKTGKAISRITINNKVVWDHGRPTTIATKAVEEDKEFVHLKQLTPGTHHLVIDYVAKEHKIPIKPVSTRQYTITLTKTDSVTKASWKGRYGKDGYVLFDTGDNQIKLPDYITEVSWKKKALGSPRLDKPVSRTGAPTNPGTLATQNPAACMQTFYVDITAATARDYTFTIRAAEKANNSTRFVIDIFDAQTKNLIHPTVLVDTFSAGSYYTFTAKQSVRIRISHLQGDDAAISGIFFQ